MHIYISCYDGAARLIIFNSISLDTSTWIKTLFLLFKYNFWFDFFSTSFFFTSLYFLSHQELFDIFLLRKGFFDIAFVFIFIVEFFVVCWENFRLLFTYCRVFQFQSIGKFIVYWYWRKWARRTRKEEDKEEVNFQLKENILDDDRLIY